MRIAVLSLGSRGDVQPMAALAQALLRRGHEVRLVTHPEFAELVPQIDFRPVVTHLTAGFERRFARDGSPLTTSRVMIGIAGRCAHDWWTQIRDHSAGVDLLVSETTAFSVAASLSEAWSIPYVNACLQPFAPTRRFPSPLLRPPVVPMPGWMNLLHHRIAQQLLWQAFRSITNNARRDVLKLEPWPLMGPYAQISRERLSVLMAYSRHVVPPAPDWEDNLDVTGFWFLNRPSHWQPPEDLRNFLDAGPPPVYFGFGSMGMRDPAATVAIILEAVRRAGCRAVIAAGWGGLRPLQVPAGLFAIETAPHDWLFPRMAAIVHHGGAGTIAAALRAGKPSIVVPFFGDQFFWAWRLRELGAAPVTIPYMKLTAAALGGALGRVLREEGPRARASELGAHIRAEDGLARAVAQIERMEPLRAAA